MALVAKYINLYSEPLSQFFVASVFGFYEYVLVIPAYSEGLDFIKNLEALNRFCKDTLIIIVVNEPVGSSPKESAKNLQLIAQLTSLGHPKIETDRAVLVAGNNMDLLVVGPLVLEKNAGVGQARKIGADIALTLIKAGQIKVPIIYGTDADAILPKDYFLRAETMLVHDEGISAFVYPFCHVLPLNPRESRAVQLYEQRLHHYVSGLAYAQSPYSFHTIASTIAVSALSYAMVRGWPRLSAGEDFYLLNKLRKVGSVSSLLGEPISLSARLSHRVPFGTGIAVAQILRLPDVELAPIFYDGAVFQYLKEFLILAEKAMITGNSMLDGMLSDDLLRRAFLSLKGATEIGAHCQQRKTATHRLKAFHDWFDAFRTLKFIHYVKDKGGYKMRHAHERINPNSLLKPEVMAPTLLTQSGLGPKQE